jgi:DNA-binding CsgD family transcriptional regulator
VSNSSIQSPLPGFSSGAQKLIENAIAKNDMEFFYKLYLARLAELSLTGKGKEFYQHAMSSIDDSPAGQIMAKGFEALANLIDLDFKKCILILDGLEKTTVGLEINPWVLQISNLCRANISFHNGNFQDSLKYAQAAINSPIKSGSLDPIDQGRLIRLICCISLILSDIDQINKCASDILNIANPDGLAELNHAKSAIESMRLLASGDYRRAYEIANSVVQIEETEGRTGVSAPFDCRFVVIRCLYEFSLISEALEQLEVLREQSIKNKSNFIFWLCEVGKLRILSRNINELGQVSQKVEELREKLLLDPTLKNMAWLVDLAEIFVKNSTNEIARVNSLVSRNHNIPYVKLLGRTRMKNFNFEDLNSVKALPEATSFELIYKNIQLSKFKSEGGKKQREYLTIAVQKGEEAGAREIFLRQDNQTLEAIINLSEKLNSQWLESLSRSCIERIKERNTLVQFGGEQLTQREIEVLKYLSTEKSVEQIGRTLHISKNTMKTHLKNIYRKLEVQNRREASQIAKSKLLV